MTLRNSGHRGIHVAGALDDAVGVNPSVEELVPAEALRVVQPASRLSELKRLLVSPAPDIPGQGFRLRNEFLRSQQPRDARIAQCHKPNWVVGRHRLGPEPLREREFGEQVLHVVGAPAVKSVPE